MREEDATSFFIFPAGPKKGIWMVGAVAEQLASVLCGAVLFSGSGFLYTVFFFFKHSHYTEHVIQYSLYVKSVKRNNRSPQKLTWRKSQGATLVKMWVGILSSVLLSRLLYFLETEKYTLDFYIKQ